MASPTPVLPEVGSTIVPLGCRAPDRSAAEIIRSAMRSLTEPPGLKYSTLASTADPGMPRVTDRSRTSGVFPTRPLNESYTCMVVLPGLAARSIVWRKPYVEEAGAMPEAVIVATARSPIGRAFKGSLTGIRPDDLAAQLVTAALAKVPQLDPADIGDLILGCGLPGGEQGFNMARVVAVLLGYDHLPGTTVNRYCSSSLQTIRMAFHAIKAGEGDAYISAGVECVSRFTKGSSDSLPDTRNPRFDEAQQRAGKLAEGGAPVWHDPRQDSKIPDIYIAMGQTAENVAGLRGISRLEQDEFGVRSQNLAEKALANGFWQRDITPATMPDGTVVSADDGPRPGTTLEKVASLKPVFRPDGTVTAGNCCPLNDGAAAVVIMSDRKAADLGITP